MNRVYDHIVFDVDGTLLDTQQLLLLSLQKTLEQVQGKTYPLEELLFSFGIPGMDTMRQLGVPEPEKAMGLWEANVYQFLHLYRLFPEIEALLEQLRAAGYTLGIVTSKTRDELKPDLETFGLGRFMTKIICAGDTTAHKPEAEPLLKYMATAGTTADRVLYVGDSVYDMLCARNAGCDFALATWGATDLTLPARLHPATPLQLAQLLEEAKEEV